LSKPDAFRAAQRSLCEDITIVRRLAECDEAIGFYESDGLAWVRRYEDWHATWCNWPRSPATRDQYFSWREATGLLEILLIQSLPIAALARRLRRRRARVVVRAQLNSRFDSSRHSGGHREGVRAKTLDLSVFPLLDLPVAVRLIASGSSATRYGGAESMFAVLGLDEKHSRPAANERGPPHWRAGPSCCAARR
jgi:hypothetical protein